MYQNFNYIPSYISNKTTQDLLNELKQHKFQIVVPLIATYSDEEIALYGVPLEVDNQGETRDYVIKEPTVIVTDVLDMLSIYDKGYGLRVVNHNDIYNIARLLTDAANELERIVDNESLVWIKRIDDFLADILNINRDNIKHMKREKLRRTQDKDPFGRDYFI